MSCNRFVDLGDGVVSRQGSWFGFAGPALGAGQQAPLLRAQVERAPNPSSRAIHDFGSTPPDQVIEKCRRVRGINATAGLAVCSRGRGGQRPDGAISARVDACPLPGIQLGDRLDIQARRPSYLSRLRPRRQEVRGACGPRPRRQGRGACQRQQPCATTRIFHVRCAALFTLQLVAYPARVPCFLSGIFARTCSVRGSPTATPAPARGAVADSLRVSRCDGWRQLRVHTQTGMSMSGNNSTCMSGIHL